MHTELFHSVIVLMPSGYNHNNAHAYTRLNSLSPYKMTIVDQSYLLVRITTQLMATLKKKECVGSGYLVNNSDSGLSL